MINVHLEIIHSKEHKLKVIIHQIWEKMLSVMEKDMINVMNNFIYML